MLQANDWQAVFHPGLRRFQGGKRCSFRVLAILLRNRFENAVYEIESRNSTELNPDLSVLSVRSADLTTRTHWAASVDLLLVENFTV